MEYLPQRNKSLFVSNCVNEYVGSYCTTNLLFGSRNIISYVVTGNIGAQIEILFLYGVNNNQW